MLRSVRLANHRSIAQEQELLLMPARRPEQVAVPVTAIYGANASGKSNVISGLAFMRSAVLESFSKWDAGGGVPRKPFRLSQEGRSQPSVYVAELVVGGVPHTYGFAVDDREVLEGWLYSYPEKRRRTLFEHGAGGELFELGDESDGTLSWLGLLPVGAGRARRRIGGRRRRDRHEPAPVAHRAARGALPGPGDESQERPARLHHARHQPARCHGR